MNNFSTTTRARPQSERSYRPLERRRPHEGELNPPCVLVFNASDPSGAGGLGGDALAMASVGAHMLPVVTGAYARDTAEIFDHFAFDEEAVAEQARAILEDVRGAADQGRLRRLARRT